MPGNFYNHSTWRIEPCWPGTASNATFRVQPCPFCAEGSFANVSGSSHCIPCDSAASCPEGTWIHVPEQYFANFTAHHHISGKSFANAGEMPGNVAPFGNFTHVLICCPLGTWAQVLFTTVSDWKWLAALWLILALLCVLAVLAYALPPRGTCHRIHAGIRRVLIVLDMFQCGDKVVQQKRRNNPHHQTGVIYLCCGKVS